MNLERYVYSTNTGYLDYEFESVGPKGSIRKVVRFTKIGYRLYNLGFGDLNESNGDIDDFIATNNADADKILATVAMIAHDFTVVRPGSVISVKGTTPARTRLYQMNISKYWDEIGIVFDISGLKNGHWQPFQKGVNYDAFVPQRI